MSRAVVNRYTAIVLLLIAVVSAIALKLSINSYMAEANVQITNELLLRDVGNGPIVDVQLYRYL